MDKENIKPLVYLFIIFVVVIPILFIFKIISDVILPDGNFPSGCWKGYTQNHSTSTQRVWRVGDICYSKLYIGTSGTTGFFGNTNQYRNIKWKAID